jgi:hypothetical protein
VSDESAKGQPSSSCPNIPTSADMARVWVVVAAVDRDIRACFGSAAGLTQRERYLIERLVVNFIATEPCRCTPMGTVHMTGPDGKTLEVKHENTIGCPVHGRAGR